VAAATAPRRSSYPSASITSHSFLIIFGSCREPAPKNIKYPYCECVWPAGQSCEEARGEVTGGVDGAPGDQAEPAPGTKYTPLTSTKYEAYTTTPISLRIESRSSAGPASVITSRKSTFVKFKKTGEFL
jgi:hypothetical protein